MSVASLRDVAQAAGVSVTTVSRVLNGTFDLPERTRTAVEAAILQFNYQPNPHARRLSRGRDITLPLRCRTRWQGFQSMTSPTRS
ncbi:MAG: LacI family DNA-binding transcriptional regulator [Rhodobacter sp.]|nr:LacI family DNA-binding transcriptional regulator [Rhodobacter sp.]